MALNLEEYFRTSSEEKMIIKPVLDLRTGTTRKLEKINEIKEMEHALTTQRKDFERRMEKLHIAQHRQDDKEEHLKDSMVKFNKFLKENDRKCARALKKACEEKQLTQQKQAELQYLKQECVILERMREKLRMKVHRNAIYKEFLLNVMKSSKKFGEIWELLSRFETLLAIREQLLRKERKEQEFAEAQRRQQRHLVEKQGDSILQYNNELSYLQMSLDQIRSMGFKWESTWNNIQSTMAKDTLLLGQMKVVTLNLFHLIGGQTGGKMGVCIDDTMEQLERIKLFIQVQTGIVHDMTKASSDQNVETNI